MDSEFGVCSMSAKLRRVAIRQPSAILSADIDEWHYAKPLNQQVLLQQFSNFVSLLETSGTEILWLDDEDDGFQRPFDRTVTSCNYPDGYKRITLSFSLWDSWLDSEYYFLNDKLFFVYEDKILNFEHGRAYFLNTNKSHTLFSYGDSYMVVLNVDCNDETKEILCKNFQVI